MMIPKLTLHFVLRMPRQHVWLWTPWTGPKVILLHLVQNSSDRWKNSRNCKVIACWFTSPGMRCTLFSVRTHSCSLRFRSFRKWHIWNNSICASSSPSN